MDAQTIVQAAESGDTERLEALLGEGADVNAKAGGGQTALMRAASGGHRAAVELLLDWGAEVNAQKNDGFTALMLAAFFGHAEVVDVLLARGADPNTVDELGSTAMRWAAARDHADIARSIKEAADGPRAPAVSPVAPPPVEAPVVPSNLNRAPVPDTFATTILPLPPVEEIAPPDTPPLVEREAPSEVHAGSRAEETWPPQGEVNEDAPEETTEVVADDTLAQGAASTPPAPNLPAFAESSLTVPSAPSRMQIDVASQEQPQSFDATADYADENVDRFAWLKYAVLALVVALVSGAITWIITEPKKPAAAATDAEATANAGNTQAADAASSTTAPPVTGSGTSANENRNAPRNGQTQGAIEARRPSPTGNEAGVLNSALDDWIAATNARELDRQMNYYAPKLVAYYTARNVSARTVRAEKRRLYARAGQVSLRTSQPEITFSADGGTAFMRFRKLYTFGEGANNRSGEVLQELIWRQTNDGWRIVSERDVQVIR